MKIGGVRRVSKYIYIYVYKLVKIKLPPSSRALMSRTAMRRLFGKTAPVTRLGMRQPSHLILLRGLTNRQRDFVEVDCVCERTGAWRYRSQTNSLVRNEEKETFLKISVADDILE
jgi:hypothetical protein